jgi:iron complex outermembrane receptor protein
MKKKNLITNFIVVARLAILPLWLTAFVTFSAVAHKGNGQGILDRVITLNMKNAEIKSVLNEIKKKTEISFVYSPTSIGTTKKVSIIAIDRKLGEVLTEILKPNNIGFKVMDGQVVLYSLNLSEKKFSPITGVVTNNKGEPVDGATVTIKGKKTSVVTNKDGQFTIDANAGDILIITSVGYENFQLQVNTEQNYSVKLTIAENIMEQVVIGSRASSRSRYQTPTPVDVIPVSQIANEVGQVDLNQIITFVAPSFQSARQTVADGTDHQDPAQLRGLGPDQVLVLINGKRRHQSALVNANGTVNRGTVGTDLSTIPANAIERIEILRDGAAAQYGSDAIAGVVNIVLKKKVNYLDANVSYGAFSSKYPKNFAQYKLTNNAADPNVKVNDGGTIQASVNYGFNIGKGLLNLTGEYTSRGETNRTGTYTGRLYANVSGNNRDDSIMAARGLNRNSFDMRIGNSQMKTAALMYNFDMPFKDGKTHFYSFGGTSKKSGNAAGFFRYPTSISGTGGSALFASTVFNIYPNGFLPLIETDIKDLSFALGIKTSLGKWNLDLSNTYGQNKFDFDVTNSISYSQAVTTTTPQTTFDAGGLKFNQNTINLDVNRKINLLEGLNIALGSEFRTEAFDIRSGELASYNDYNGSAAPPAGSQVFAGFLNTIGGKQSRTSIALYSDNELDITSKWLLTAAIRFENYSDFGSTLNYKFSTRYKVSDNFNLRASTSSGFRAPSMQQRFYTKTNTVFVSSGGGLVPVEAGTFPNNSVPAQILGIPALKQETSNSMSVGFTAKPFKGFEVTVDAYKINIDDRIVLTNNFGAGGNATIAAQLAAAGAGAANFFTNAVDTKAKGLESVLSYTTNFGKNQSLKVILAGTFIKNEVVKDANGKAVIKASPTLVSTNQVGSYFNREDQSRIEVANPQSKISATVNYKVGKFSTMLRFVNFGKVVYIDPTIDPANPAAFPINAFTGQKETLDQTFSAKTVTDLSLSYQVTKAAQLTLGANNLFDVKQDIHTHSGNMSTGRFVYSRRVQQMGFNGAYYFVRVRVGLATN